MLPRRTLAWLVAIAAPLAGCQPDIGDECSTALDCSSTGDRLCDTSQPGGYCTLFNCEPGTCPEEAACVAFNQSLDPACRETDDGRFGRFARTFCMYICDDDDDCRGGYECVRPIDRAANVVDRETDEDNPQDTRVCLVRGSVPSIPGEIPPVCTPQDAGTLPDPYLPDAGAGAQGGAGGSGGSGGAAGTGGAGNSGGAGGSTGSGGAGGSTGSGGAGGAGGT